MANKRGKNKSQLPRQPNSSLALPDEMSSLAKSSGTITDASDPPAQPTTTTYQAPQEPLDKDISERERVRKHLDRLEAQVTLLQNLQEKHGEETAELMSQLQAKDVRIQELEEQARQPQLPAVPAVVNKSLLMSTKSGLEKICNRIRDLKRSDGDLKNLLDKVMESAEARYPDLVNAYSERVLYARKTRFEHTHLGPYRIVMSNFPGSLSMLEQAYEKAAAKEGKAMGDSESALDQTISPQSDGDNLTIPVGQEVFPQPIVNTEQYPFGDAINTQSCFDDPTENHEISEDSELKLQDNVEEAMPKTDLIQVNAEHKEFSGVEVVYHNNLESFEHYNSPVAVAASLVGHGSTSMLEDTIDDVEKCSEQPQYETNVPAVAKQDVSAEEIQEVGQLDFLSSPNNTTALLQHEPCGPEDHTIPVPEEPRNSTVEEHINNDILHLEASAPELHATASKPRLRSPFNFSWFALAVIFALVFIASACLKFRPTSYSAISPSWNPCTNPYLSKTAFCNSHSHIPTATQTPLFLHNTCSNDSKGVPSFPSVVLREPESHKDDAPITFKEALSTVCRKVASWGRTEHSNTPLMRSFRLSVIGTAFVTEGASPVRHNTPRASLLKTLRYSAYGIALLGEMME